MKELTKNFKLFAVAISAQQLMKWQIKLNAHLNTWPLTSNKLGEKFKQNQCRQISRCLLLLLVSKFHFMPKLLFHELRSILNKEK